MYYHETLPHFTLNNKDFLFFHLCCHSARTYGAHQGIQDTDSEGRAAGERLGEVQLRVWVVVVILIQELHIGVVHCGSFSDTLIKC